MAKIKSLCDLPQPLSLEGQPRVLVFVPHPDDESLGCGGTLALLAEQSAVKVILVTDGSGAGGLPAGAVEVRRREFLAALATLGVTDSEQWNYPDGAFFDSSGFQTKVQGLLKSYQPDWVMLPSPLDYHRDHLTVSVAVQSACATSRKRLTRIYYEVWSPLPATHYLDITSVVDRKFQAVDCHQTALACGPYRSALMGLNAYRGLYRMDRETPRFAEAFCVDPDGSFGEALTAFALHMRGVSVI